MTSNRSSKAARSNESGTKPKPAKTPKASGRPPGSKNKRYAAAKHIPPVCPDPTCASTNLKAVRGSVPIVRELAGVLEHGFAYSKVKWQRCECADCGQHVTVRTYFPAKDNA